jgi:hypothetical protein
MLFLYFPGEFLLTILDGKTYNWMEAFLSVACPLLLLFGLIRVTKVGWYTLVTLVALWGVRDLNTYYASRGASFVPLVMHIGIYSVSLFYFINPRVRHLYFDPQMCWWKTRRRFETHMPFLLKHQDQWLYPILRNINEGGCFVETPNPLSVNSAIEISIPLPSPLNVAVIKTMGEVRWVSHHPSRLGMGVQFTDPPAEQVKALQAFTQRF